MQSHEETHVRLSDGYSAYARYWPNAECKEAVLHLHGIQSHAGWYDAAATALCNAGFAVLQPDRRGSGQNSQMRGHAESSQQLIDDGLVCARHLLRTSGAKRLHVVGVSWGGKLAAAMHVTEPSLFASVSLIAPGVYPVVTVSAAEKFRIGFSMVSDPTKHYDIPLNDPELFTADPKYIEYLQNDSLQIHQATAGFYLASRRMDKVVAKMPKASPVPLHTFLAGDERIIDNERTTEWVRSFGWPHSRISTYEQSRHTLEFGPQREEFLADLVNWIRNPTTDAI
ncbi:MAG: alpha/beta hydrolase [Planctomycetes bacterium]|nr:alpha/beta hydrolase [Planctomycetota bacterium]